MRPLVLVDFDGVVVRSREATSYVSKKAAAFVAKHARINCPQTAREFNRALYTSHGHTVLGLQKHGFDVKMRDYNDYMYSNVEEYCHLSLTPDEKKQWNSFIDCMNNHGFDVKFFSNSDSKWMSHFVKIDEKTYSMFEFQWYLESQSDIGQTYMLKPDRDIYDALMYAYPRRTYHFIDDKVANFAYIHDDSRWIKYWFSGLDENALVSWPAGQRFYGVSQLSDVSSIMVKNDGRKRHTQNM